MTGEQLALVSVGVALMIIALMVEVEHKVIWRHYKESYHKHQNKFIDNLLKPNIWVYRLNIFVVWPLVLLLGVAIIYINLQ